MSHFSFYNFIFGAAGRATSLKASPFRPAAALNTLNFNLLATFFTENIERKFRLNHACPRRETPGPRGSFLYEFVYTHKRIHTHAMFTTVTSLCLRLDWSAL